MARLGPQDDDFLDAELEQIELTRPQKDCVEFKLDGPLHVHGVPGSGKTTVLLARAAWLMARSQGEKVLVLTYNKALARYMRALAQKAGCEMGQVTHFHEWASGLLREMGVPKLAWVFKHERRDIIEHALNTVRKYNPEINLPAFSNSWNQWERSRLVTFLGDEFEWIKGQAIRTEAEYLKAERTGRGASPRLDADMRRGIWEVLAKYDELVYNYYHRRDPDDLALLLMDKASQVPASSRPVHVLVDEGQDLSAAQYRAIVALKPRTLTIAADKGQKIYRRPFSWRAVGIDIRGGRTKGLPTTHRSTRQIIELAQSLLKNDGVLKGDEEYIPEAVPTTEGPPAELYVSPDLKAEVKTVLDCVRKLRLSKPNHTIGVLARDNGRLEEFAQALDAARIPRVTVSEEGADLLSPGVKLVTYHSAKGLEFHHVICTGLMEEIFPLKKPKPGDDEQEFLSTERRTLYVGMSRAKLTLTLSAVEPISRFIRELDPKLYMKRV